MKIYLYILITFFTLAVAHGQTSKYFPFPNSNASWNVHWYSLNPSHTCMNEDYETLFINGDTVIGSFTYHKIYHVGYTAYSCWNPPTSPVNTNYSSYYDCAIRQDSLQKKVFIYKPPYAPNDTMLYDFNLNLGDTVPLTFDGAYFETVSKIDSALVGTKYHKKFVLQGNFPDTLIEGIGSVYYGLYGLRGIFPDGGNSFICFANNIATYPANSNCSTLTTSIPEITIPTITLFPNPFSTQTVLRTDNLFSNATLTVYNSFGQEVRQIKNISGQAVTLFRENLPSGLYFIRLVQNNKVVATDKLVITDN